MSSELFRKKSMRNQYNNQALSERAKSARDARSEREQGIDLESIENLEIESREESPDNNRVHRKL